MTTSAPVEVTFLPVVDVAPAPVEKAPAPMPKPAEPVKSPERKKKAPVTAPREVAKIEKVKPVQPQIKAPEPEMTASVRENVCAPPQDVLCAEPAEMQTANLEVGVEAEISGHSQENAADPVDLEVVVSGKGDAGHVMGSPLIEAVPRYSSNPLPEYPYLARQRRWEGVVWLLVNVSAEGDVEGLEVERSSGYKILDRSASRTVRSWRFAPATRGGLPVSSQARIPVRFRLEGG